MVPMQMKDLKNLEDFKNKTRRCKPDGCELKLCKDFVSNLGSVSLVWLWDIRFTVRIRKFCLISSAKKYLLCRHLSASSRNVETAAGCEMGTALTIGGNRVMSMMSLRCIYYWLWASFCVSFLDFQWEIADCLDLPLLHSNFLTGVNSLQLNSSNSNSCNSKDHLNRTNSSVHSEFASKILQEKSFNSNSHNSKNHLNRTNFWVPWTYFSSCNSNFGFGV